MQIAEQHLVSFRTESGGLCKHQINNEALSSPRPKTGVTTDSSGLFCTSNLSILTNSFGHS
jgi:hypothetical protein